MNKEKHREYYKDYELSIYDDNFALIKKDSENKHRRLVLKPGLSLAQQIYHTKDFIKLENR